MAQGAVALSSSWWDEREVHLVWGTGDCKYQTKFKVSLDLHSIKVHLKSTTTHQTPTKIKEKFKLHCTHCPFKARLKQAFEQHNSCHIVTKLQSINPICTFSVGKLFQLNQHLKLYSGETERLAKIKISTSLASIG